MTTDRLSARARMTAYLQQAGLSTARAEANVDALLAEAAVPSAAAQTTQAAKAEALLLHFTAEAHRRKWSYDRGLDDDGVPITSEAFDALHRLGEEMRVALEKLRRLAVLPAPVDRAAVMEEGATALEALDPVEAALAGQHAWKDAAALLRRLAEAPQPETQADEPDDTVHACPGRWGGPACRCFDAAAPAVVAQPGKENS